MKERSSVRLAASTRKSGWGGVATCGCYASTLRGSDSVRSAWLNAGAVSPLCQKPSAKYSDDHTRPETKMARCAIARRFV
eukprot:355089-Prymnesium_polylepis.3